MTEAFVRNIEQFVASEGVDLISFEKGPARDRAAGYRYQLSILQAEFSLRRYWITR